MTARSYQIVVEGHLDGKWAGWFGGLELAPGVGRDGQPLTLLSGAVPDQAALHGILARIRDLELTLISVTRLDT
jgi:hypothetical protein